MMSADSGIAPASGALGVLTMHRNGAHDGPESVLTFARNHCSRCTGMGAHDAPEYANSKVKYCVPSKEFGFRIAHGRPLDKNSFAIDYFEQGTIDERIQSVLASAWVKNSKIERGACIKEHSIAQPHYNSVLTLLWIDQDIDGRYYEEDEEEQEADLDHFTPDGKRWRW